MSRLWPDSLWPDTWLVGLFPDAAWLQRRGGKGQATVEVPSENPWSAATSLAALLDRQPKKLRKGSVVDIVVSDSTAAVTALPWQDNLRRAAEWSGYAQAAFSKQGAAIDDAWALHVEFARYRETGLAYAFPQAWIAELLAVLEARQLRLRSVLPISAVAYNALGSKRHDGKSLILIEDARQQTVLAFDKGGLCSIDMEPVIASPQEACVRLLKRTAVHVGDIKRVDHWVANQAGEPSLSTMVADSMPGATVHTVARDGWMK